MPGFKLSDLNPDEVNPYALRFVNSIRHHISSLQKPDARQNENAQLLLLSTCYDSLAYELSSEHSLYSSVKEAASEIRKQLIEKPIAITSPYNQFTAFRHESKRLKEDNASEAERAAHQDSFREFCADASLQCYLNPKDRLDLAQWAHQLGGKNDAHVLLAYGLALLENEQEARGLNYLSNSFVLNLNRLVDGKDDGNFIDFIKAAITLYQHYDAQLERKGSRDEDKAYTVLLNTMMVYPEAVGWCLPDFQQKWNALFDFDKPESRISRLIENAIRIKYVDVTKNPNARIVNALENQAKSSGISDKDKSRAFGWLAYYHYFTGNSAAAYEAADEGISLNPKGLQIKSNLLKWDGRTEEAMACLVACVNEADAPRMIVYSLTKLWRKRAEEKFAEGDSKGGLKLAFQAMEYSRMQELGRFREAITPHPIPEARP